MKNDDNIRRHLSGVRMTLERIRRLKDILDAQITELEIEEHEAQQTIYDRMNGRPPRYPKWDI